MTRSATSAPTSIHIILRSGESSATKSDAMVTSPLLLSKEEQDAGLSRLGKENAKFLDGPMKKILSLFRNAYDADTNPDGLVILGVADNGLLREELIKLFSSDFLKLTGPELTYGDRIFSSTRLVNALCRLFNDLPLGLPERGESPKLIEPVKPDHLVLESGATGILDSLASILCNPGDGVLVSVPMYNGFDHDFAGRAEAKIVEVYTPLPEVIIPGKKTTIHQPSPAFTADTVKAYEEALERAKKQGIKVRILLVCNPHNPTGLIYPHDTLIALAKLAARENLHFVSDEIYAHSVYPSSDIPLPTSTPFESILAIDVEKEAGLPRSRVHVVTSASKDFGVNGLRLGIYINQGNDRAIAAMTSLSLFSQTASPAGALFYKWLENDKLLKCYFAENHRRMAMAYKYVTQWAHKHKIPYVPANAGHFILTDFGRFLDSRIETMTKTATKREDDDDDDESSRRRKAEAQLSQDFLDAGVFLGPGAQYHHPIPGWFRLTFCLGAKSVREGLARIEEALGLESWVRTLPALDYTLGEERLARLPANEAEADEMLSQIHRLSIAPT